MGIFKARRGMEHTEQTSRVMGGGAERVVREGMCAAGFDVGVDGTDWEISPRTVWVNSDRPLDLDDITLDGGPVDIFITLGDQTRRGVVAATPIAHRFTVDTLPTTTFSVPYVPGKVMLFEVTAVCSTRADGKPLRGTPLRRTLAAGSFTVPEETHDMGVTGTGFMPTEGGYAFLHTAEVAGELRYIAAHMSFKHVA